MNEKKRNSFGVIAFIINILIFFINIFMFLSMLVEQIKIGKSTKNELAAL